MSKPEDFTEGMERAASMCEQRADALVAGGLVTAYHAEIAMTLRDMAKAIRAEAQS